ncbi:histidine kinase dimerization/phospho-acceptor domain-containing protein [Microcoleus sp. bin38.metabat.b11b12b14.051]|uniref:sensor histidine kinase n=1 Tax=Microcoleus sp. bin38.metabat.b11b12b14.051 TaxID=2742709 RepID=UPI0025FDE3EC|nr:histidine kinase dimerization/phospho-acceptor domain-containing protein [Microcoleus sp. bin38.metabat.b11b12b14.051]
MNNKPIDLSSNSIKIKLLNHLAQELLTPLTSVIGMASVLNQEIYGPLTSKQKEYIDVIQDSSRSLRSLVEEILELAELDDSSFTLKRTAVDIESLCQQVVTILLPAASKREQEINLSMGPGPRIWLADKDKVQQMLHHLIFSIIQSAGAGSVIRIHVSRKEEGINIGVWVFHPWLGESLPHAKLYSDYLLKVGSASGGRSNSEACFLELEPQLATQTQRSQRLTLEFSELAALVAENAADTAPVLAGYGDRERLGLLLCCQLVEIQGGQLSIQGTGDSGYRYVLWLPCTNATELLEG